MKNHSVQSLSQSHLKRYHWNQFAPTSTVYPTILFDQVINSVNPINFHSYRTLPSAGPQIQSFQSDKNILIQKEIYVNNKHKRHTLPCIWLNKPVQYSSSAFSPKNISSINRKINFTYKTNITNTQSSLIFPSSYVGLKNQTERIGVFQLQRRESKKMRNKLNSDQFSFAYLPDKSSKIQNYDCIVSKSKNSISIIQQCKTSFIQTSNIKVGSQSKIASTIATESFYSENKKSDLPSQDNFENSNTFKVSYFGNYLKGDLLDGLPIRKQLGQTVIIAKNDYSFGGIIEHPDLFLFPTPGNDGSKLQGNEFNIREWNNPLTCLIDNRESKDLKQSIHCGPQLRLQRHKFEMLDNFGRQIKESNISIRQ